MEIAVTGASGFVGGYVARGLARLGHNVIPFGRRPEESLPFPLPGYVQWELPGGPPGAWDVDAVVHCAAHVGHWGADAPYRRVNVEGTRAVLAGFPGARRLVHVSTSSVYAANQPIVQLEEAAPVGEPALTPYARTKAEAEEVVRRSGRPAIILRPHIIYGPGDRTLLPRLLAARRFGVLPVPGDGRNSISVTSVANLLHAVELALSGPVASGTFNIADAETPTVDALLRTILRRLGIQDRLVHIPRATAWAVATVSERLWVLAGASRPPRLTRYVVANLADECTLDITLARTRLGYSPVWTYRDGPLNREPA